MARLLHFCFLIKPIIIIIIIIIIKMLRALSSRRAKKKVIGLKGSSYHNQEVFDLTNANELIKIFGMILFTYEKHLKENNSITILKAGTQ